MSIDSTALADRLADATATATGDGGTCGWLWPVLLRLLAAGRPVTVDDLAEATGHSQPEVRDGLEALPDTEYDDHGRVVGHGLTLRETPHRFTVDGHQLYTWCALDTLIFPTVLQRAATVVSPTPGSGEVVSLTVDPHAGVTALDPPTALVSVLVPPTPAPGVRAAFCHQVHFFATPAAAHDWLTEHPGGAVLAVHDAITLGRRLAHDLLHRSRRCC